MAHHDKSTNFVQISNELAPAKTSLLKKKMRPLQGVQDKFFEVNRICYSEFLSHEVEKKYVWPQVVQQFVYVATLFSSLTTGFLSQKMALDTLYYYWWCCWVVPQGINEIKKFWCQCRLRIGESFKNEKEGGLSSSACFNWIESSVTFLVENIGIIYMH